LHYKFYFNDILKKAALAPLFFMLFFVFGLGWKSGWKNG